MCQLCDGSMVIVTGFVTGLRFAPCPICKVPDLPEDHPDYHPGQSLTIGWPDKEVEQCSPISEYKRHKDKWNCPGKVANG